MQDNVVTIHIGEEKITCSGYTRFVKEKNGKFSWYIPGFEMYFSSSTVEEGRKISHAMVKSFFVYWVEKENNFNQMILEITRLGFRAIDHRNTVNKMLRGKKHKANFESNKPINDPAFADSEVEELQLEVA